MMECPICLDDYVASASHSNGPVAGRCGHSFCRGCVEKLHVAACEMFNPRIKNLDCPICKAEKVFRADRLVPNWAAINFIGSATEVEAKDKLIKTLETKKKELVDLLEAAEATTKKLEVEIKTKCAEAEQKDAEALELSARLKAMEEQAMTTHERPYGERKSPEMAKGNEELEIIDLCSDDDDHETPKIMEVSDEEATKIREAADGLAELQQRRQSSRNARSNSERKRESDTATAPSIEKKRKSIYSSNYHLIGVVFPPVLQHQPPPMGSAFLPDLQHQRTAPQPPHMTIPQQQPQQQMMPQAQQGIITTKYTVPLPFPQQGLVTTTYTYFQPYRK